MCLYIYMYTYLVWCMSWICNSLCKPLIMAASTSTKLEYVFIKYTCFYLGCAKIFFFLLQGAREFLVPTREKGKFYALVQSPQQVRAIVCFTASSKTLISSLAKYCSLDILLWKGLANEFIFIESFLPICANFPCKINCSNSVQLKL